MRLSKEWWQRELKDVEDMRDDHLILFALMYRLCDEISAVERSLGLVRREREMGYMTLRGLYSRLLYNGRQPLSAAELLFNGLQVANPALDIN